jgi:altronate dehydratase
LESHKPDELASSIEAASGRLTKAEEKGLPEYEFVPWQPGIVI